MGNPNDNLLWCSMLGDREFPVTAIFFPSRDSDSANLYTCLSGKARRGSVIAKPHLTRTLTCTNLWPSTHSVLTGCRVMCHWVSLTFYLFPVQLNWKQSYSALFFITGCFDWHTEDGQVVKHSLLGNVRYNDWSQILHRSYPQSV